MKKVGVSMDWFKSSRGKKTEDYEKDYLTRYKKGEKSKPKRKTSKQKKETEEKSDEIEQKNQIEKSKEESEPLSTKFESARQEYNITIKNLMNAKRDLKNLKENIEKSKSDIGWGHQIRSYVLHPYRLVKDNRTAEESSDPDKILNGDIDNFLESSLYKLNV